MRKLEALLHIVFSKKFLVVTDNIFLPSCGYKLSDLNNALSQIEKCKENAINDAVSQANLDEVKNILSSLK